MVGDCYGSGCFSWDYDVVGVGMVEFDNCFFIILDGGFDDFIFNGVVECYWVVVFIVYVEDENFCGGNDGVWCFNCKVWIWFWEFDVLNCECY